LTHGDALVRARLLPGLGRYTPVWQCQGRRSFTWHGKAFSLRSSPPGTDELVAPALTKPQTEQALRFVAEVEGNALVVDAAQLRKSRLAAARRLIDSPTSLQSLRSERLWLAVGLSLVCSENVQVWYCVMRGEGSELGERSWLYIAAVFAHTAEQSFPHGAEGSVSPARILDPEVALLPLQSPLQRIIHDPPGLVELGYELI